MWISLTHRGVARKMLLALYTLVVLLVGTAVGGGGDEPKEKKNNCTELRATRNYVQARLLWDGQKRLRFQMKDDSYRIAFVSGESSSRDRVFHIEKVQ